MQADLDDVKTYQQSDPGGMLAHLHRMPELCRRAWREAQAFSLPSEYRQANKVVILGMGGSAIGGDLVKSLVAQEVKIPVFVSRDYTPPAFVDGGTLVIASSHSGMTAETLASFRGALARGARGLAITTGGELQALAAEKGVPAFVFDYQAPPRAALPFSILPVLYFLQRLGFVGDKSADVAEAIATLQGLAAEIGEAIPSAQNPAKQLAARLFGKLAVVYGGGITAEVAHRWKTQLNENSKAWAFYEVFPELNHNAVAAYRFPREMASRTMVVLLRSSHLSEPLRRGYEAVGQLLEQAGVERQVVDALGTSQLSQIMSLVLFGDYVSFYLALLYGVDPTPVASIDYVKRRLAGKG